MHKLILIALLASGCAPLNHTHVQEKSAVVPWSGSSDDPWGMAKNSPHLILPGKFALDGGAK